MGTWLFPCHPGEVLWCGKFNYFGVSWGRVSGFVIVERVGKERLRLGEI